MRRFLGMLVCAAIAAGCGNDDGDDDVPGVFDPSVTEVRVEIDYETGQEHRAHEERQCRRQEPPVARQHGAQPPRH